MSTRAQRDALFAARPQIQVVLDIEERLKKIAEQRAELDTEEAELRANLQVADAALDRELVRVVDATPRTR